MCIVFFSVYLVSCILPVSGNEIIKLLDNYDKITYNRTYSILVVCKVVKIKISDRIKLLRQKINYFFIFTTIYEPYNFSLDYIAQFNIQTKNMDWKIRNFSEVKKIVDPYLVAVVTATTQTSQHQLSIHRFGRAFNLNFNNITNSFYYHTSQYIIKEQRKPKIFIYPK